MEFTPDEKAELRRLCRVCRTIFAGKAKAGPFTNSYWHHQDYDSLKFSRGDCRLCFEIFAEGRFEFVAANIDIVIVCVAGTTSESHSGRPFHQVQFEIYTAQEQATEEDQYVFGALGLQRARRIAHCGTDYLQSVVICFEMQKIATFSPQRCRDDIGHRSSSQVSIDQVKSWYQRCQSHTKCANSMGCPTLLPDRVLDIEKKGDSKTIRLHIRDRSEIRHSPFIALSYCWGDKDSIKLTRDTEASLQSGVSAQSLPRTFRNAIALARDLRFRFLWIDSLCIFQDSVVDWQKQADLMGGIYKRSSLCVAATSAEDCHEGLFFERDAYMLQPIRAYTQWPFHDESVPKAWYNCFLQAPYNNNIMGSHLNTRGWVVQERLLPSRVLHCSKKELVWECNEMIASETFPQGITAVWDHRPADRLLQLLSSNARGPGEADAHDGWSVFSKGSTPSLWEGTRESRESRQGLCPALINFYGAVMVRSLRTSSTSNIKSSAGHHCPGRYERKLILQHHKFKYNKLYYITKLLIHQDINE
ncbi:HET-domain-containing protein [Polyplosphaeria fusca]|uniref:HET-domain-containing protein n=1 Tax=Polyplosphaeria fusca TaxID=682080 RepID=A0A9P4UW05_9PLEO|nr:HET-domain-containing protein [Polyplosphaeria fusca]